MTADATRERWNESTRLIAKAEPAIEHLGERRNTLISAAFNGKIDVRKFAHQKIV